MMEKKPTDFLTGCIVIAIFIALSAYAGGTRALLYIGGALVAGAVVLCLLKYKSKKNSVDIDEAS
jgi:hypothetical protein